MELKTQTVSSLVYGVIKSYKTGDHFITDDLVAALDLQNCYSSISGTLNKLVRKGMIRVINKQKGNRGRRVYVYEIVDPAKPISVISAIKSIKRARKVGEGKKRVPLELGDAPHAIKYKGVWHLCHLVPSSSYGYKDTGKVWSEDRTTAYICGYDETEKRVRLE